MSPEPLALIADRQLPALLYGVMSELLHVPPGCPHAATGVFTVIETDLDPVPPEFLQVSV